VKVGNWEGPHLSLSKSSTGFGRYIHDGNNLAKKMEKCSLATRLLTDFLIGARKRKYDEFERKLIVLPQQASDHS
jgi:hypothetical protein